MGREVYPVHGLDWSVALDNLVEEEGRGPPINKSIHLFFANCEPH
jgi:hypothetical protein